MDGVILEARSFIAKCYGAKCNGDVSEIRFVVWSSKMANCGRLGFYILDKSFNDT